MEFLRSEERALLYSMSDGSFRPVRHVPNTEHGLRVAEIFGKARDALQPLEAKRREIKSSPNLTAAGKEAEMAKLEGERAAVAGVFAQAANELEEFAKAVEVAEATVATPPALARDDHASIALDRELRDVARAASGDLLGQLVSEAAEGGPLAVAVLRNVTAVPAAVVEAARQGFTAKAMASEPGRAVAQMREALEWGRETIATFKPFAQPAKAEARPAA